MSVSKVAAVVVLLSLRLRATGPELGSRRLDAPAEAVRPSRLRARLPDDNFRVRPFCLGKDEEKEVFAEEGGGGGGISGSPIEKPSTVENEF